MTTQQNLGELLDWYDVRELSIVTEVASERDYDLDHFTTFLHDAILDDYHYIARVIPLEQYIKAYEEIYGGKK